VERPRCEVDSGFLPSALKLADTSTAMYISIMSHEHGIKGKEFLAFKHQLVCYLVVERVISGIFATLPACGKGKCSKKIRKI
jgi:hypothetical protein